jgi:hypothetical protein
VEKPLGGNCQISFASPDVPFAQLVPNPGATRLFQAVMDCARAARPDILRISREMALSTLPDGIFRLHPVCQKYADTSSSQARQTPVNARAQPPASFEVSHALLSSAFAVCWALDAPRHILYLRPVIWSRWALASMSPPLFLMLSTQCSS